MVNLLHRLYGGDNSVLQNPTYTEIVDSLCKAGLLFGSEELEQEATLLARELPSPNFSPTRVTFLVNVH